MQTWPWLASHSRVRQPKELHYLGVCTPAAHQNHLGSFTEDLGPPPEIPIELVADADIWPGLRTTGPGVTFSC